MKSLPLLTIALVALAASACSDKPPVAPGQGAPGAPAATPIPGSPASKVEWIPEALLGAPGEFIAEPGSGRTWLQGTVVDTEGNPVHGATVEMHALPRAVPFLAPLFHARAISGPDGAFRVGPGPSPWWIQGMLSAHAPGFARASLRSSSLTQPGMPCAEEGQHSRLVLHPGHLVKGEVRGRDGGPPDGPVTIWAAGAEGFFAVVESDAGGAFQFVAPQGPLSVRSIEGAHPAAMGAAVVLPGADNHVGIVVTRGRDIQGKVVDGATGKPVAGAVIRGYYGSTRILRTGPDGEFVLPKFWYSAFQVRSPGYAVRTHQLADDAGKPGVGPETVRLVPGFVARGKVLDLDGRPLARARLRILTTDPAGDRSASAGPFSGPDGSFVFVGLPLPVPGHEIRIFATAEECAWGVTAPLPGTTGSVVDGVEVRLPRLVDLAGRMEDEKGGPVAARIDVQWDVAKELAPYGDVVPTGGTAFAGEDGAWRIRVPERNPFRIVARGGHFGEAPVEGVSPAASAGPEEAKPVLIKVDRGLAVRGTVVDAEGNPVRRGEVRVEPHPPTDPRPSRDAHIDQDGTFEAGGLAEGAYDFSVLVHPEFLQEVVRDVPAGGPPVKVVLRRAGGLRFRVILPADVPEGTIPEVTLRALEDTRPLAPDYSVRLDPYDPVGSIGPLSPAAYSLAITAGDYRYDDPRVVVQQRVPTDLGNLEVKPAGVVTGKVTLGGVPMRGAAVEVLRRLPDGTSQTVKRVTTSGTGTFRVGGMLAGAHLLAVRCQDRPFVEASFEAVTGEVTTLDVPLSAGGRLRVTVKDAAGQPVPGARLVFSRDGAGIPAWKEGSPAPGPHETGPDGTLRCTGLPAGDILVTAEKSGAGSGEATAKAVDGAEGDVEVRFGK